MSENRKIVVIAEKSSVHGAHGEHVEKDRRTAVFDDNTTLREIVDWAKERNEEFNMYFWENAKISIHEDEVTKPKRDMDVGFFAQKTEMEDAA